MIKLMKNKSVHVMYRIHDDVTSRDRGSYVMQYLSFMCIIFFWAAQIEAEFFVWLFLFWKGNIIKLGSCSELKRREKISKKKNYIEIIKHSMLECYSIKCVFASYGGWSQAEISIIWFYNKVALVCGTSQIECNSTKKKSKKFIILSNATYLF